MRSSDRLSTTAVADKVSGCGAVTVHGHGSVDVSNGGHAGQLAKPVAGIRDSHKGDQRNGP